MKILAIDSSTDVCSAALHADGELIGEILLRSREMHLARLMPAVEQLMRFAGWTLPELSAVAVTRGPGSFTGVRVALATAKTLAYTAQIPIVALNSLEVLAGNFLPQPGLIATVFDARKKEVFGAAFRSSGGEMVRVLPPRAANPEAFARDLATAAAPDEMIILAGSGVRPYGAVFTSILAGRVTVAPAVLWQPRAAVAAELAARQLAAGGAFERIDGVREYAQVNPEYCRKSEAELGWESRTGTAFVPPPPENRSGH